MKKCPFCAESIQDEAIKCRYCQSFLDGAKPGPSKADAEDEGEPEAGAEPEPAASTEVDDGWGELADQLEKKKKKSAAKKENKHPVLLRPAVSTSDEPAPEKRADEEPTSRRKVLYSGSPSWRAFFNHYALATVAAILVPLFCFWIAGLLDAGWFGRMLAVLIPLGFAAVAFLAINVYRKSKVYRVTTTNIESEYGVLSKKIDVLELWRCRDVRYQQSLMDRILRIAHIEVMTADVTTPQLCINGLPASRQLFEKIRDSIEIQRQARNVVGFVQ